jgi:hypothetical protein
MLKPKGSQSSACTHIHQTNQKDFKNVVCQKADGNYFLGRERSADGGIQRTAITSEVYFETLRKLRRAIQNKWHGMLT